MHSFFSQANINPKSISGLSAWWQADDVILSGSKITQFNDKSGNNRHMSSSNTTYQLTQSIDSAYNNKIIAITNGSANQVYTCASFTVAQPFTIFAVGDVNGTLGADYETFIDSANAGTRVIMRTDLNFNFIVYAGNTNVTLRTYNSKTNPSIAWCEYNGASTKGNVNLSAATSLLMPGTNSLTQPQLFVGNGNSYYMRDGAKFGTLLIYNRTLTATERKKVMSYFASYYNIRISDL